MPKDSSIESILVIGAGPIVIGQACEFDYSGSQACKALKEEGYRVVLINSNPATIMTDPEIADATYIEPIKPEIVASICEKEKIDAILPSMGGQTAINCVVGLIKKGFINELGIKVIGSSIQSIEIGENRRKFGDAMASIGLKVPVAKTAYSMQEAEEIVKEIGFPCIIRPDYTLGGEGGGIAYNIEELFKICKRGFSLSSTSSVQIDKSLLGWKEFELEVMRDKADNVIVVCSIENIDPMGIHTGDSITVAPHLTLTDKEYQKMRDAAIAVLRKVGIETGGANVQFAVNPENGDLVVIEMNPRVSRSSALASKATGFPIAKVAAKLAVGYLLDELKNEITGDILPASFEPSIDYIVVKIPYFNFDKFPQEKRILGTEMKSFGEVMSFGRNFKEAFQKALFSLDKDNISLGSTQKYSYYSDHELEKGLHSPTDERIFLIGEALKRGFSVEHLAKLTSIDPWFLNQFFEIIEIEKKLLSCKSYKDLNNDDFYFLKQNGFCDLRIANIFNVDEKQIRNYRISLGIIPVFKGVDSCAGEVISPVSYMYSSYFYDKKYKVSDIYKSEEQKKVIVLGSGPNRIGQGIEFDYGCVHAVQGFKELGFKTIMVNCNPETVSTDFDTSDKLYIEPISVEHILNIAHCENAKNVVVQFGGQTPLSIADDLVNNGLVVMGTFDAIKLCEDRYFFNRLCKKLGIKQPQNYVFSSYRELINNLDKLAYPLIIRPSYVLGGQAMEIVYNKRQFENYLAVNNIVNNEDKDLIFIDKFLDGALELDVDILCDGNNSYIAGMMQHIEGVGIHSGDSSASLPPHNLADNVIKRIEEICHNLVKHLKIKGAMNVQFAYLEDKDEIFIIEANPRMSRTLPFIAKAVGIPFARYAAYLLAGKKIADLKLQNKNLKYFCVKQAIFPFERFYNTDPILGPQMRSTGEVMGIGKTFTEAFAKAALASKVNFPKSGTILMSVDNRDKPSLLTIAKKFNKHGYKIIATKGTYEYLKDAGIEATKIGKVNESRPNIVDLIKNGLVDVVINTVHSSQAVEDSKLIRCSAVSKKIPYSTTISEARVVCEVMSNKLYDFIKVDSIQSWFKKQT